MRFLLVVLLSFIILSVCEGQEMKVGTTIVVDEDFKAKVLDDGTTTYTKVDTAYKTYLGKCDLCGEDLYAVWKKSSGVKVPDFYGYKFHPECLGKAIDYLGKKLKLRKK